MAEYTICEFTNEGLEKIKDFLNDNLTIIGKGRRAMNYLPEESTLYAQV